MSAIDVEPRLGLVAVAGGTGTLGGHVVARLTGHGTRVRILARDPARARSLENERTEVVAGDVRDRAALAAAVEGCDAVVSAFTAFGRPQGGDLQSTDLQGNINLIRAAENAESRFVLVSWHGAAPDSPLELGRVKYQVEQVLKASSSTWTIIRPTASMELYLKLLAAPLLEHHKARIFGRGDNPINFISQRDVAAFIELALTDRDLDGRAIDIGGPEDLSANQLVRRFEQLTGAKGGEQHVPRPMLRAMAVIMKPLSPTLARQVRSAVLMDTADMTFDDREIARSYPSIHRTQLEEVVRRDFTKAA
jgi:NADH dehydrogenase